MRNDSLIIRFKRFLLDARRQFFLPIARPSRGSLLLLARYSTVNILSRLRPACLNTRPNDALSASRFWRLKRKSVRSVLSRFVAGCPGLPHLRRQLRPTFGATAFQYKTTGLGCHACSKSVRACPLQCAGLKCTFHLGATWLVCLRACCATVFISGVFVPTPEKAGKGTRGPHFCQ